MTDENAINNWQLYKADDNLWYWQVWDEVNSRWWVSQGFEDYTEAAKARDGMMSDKYQDDLLNGHAPAGAGGGGASG